MWLVILVRHQMHFVSSNLTTQFLSYDQCTISIMSVNRSLWPIFGILAFVELTAAIKWETHCLSNRVTFNLFFLCILNLFFPQVFNNICDLEDQCSNNF